MHVATVLDMPRPDITDVLLGWGESLVRHRNAAGLTREAVAVELGVSMKTVQRWETVGRDGGGNIPDTFAQRRLANLYGVSVTELLPRSSDEAELPDLVARLGAGCS